MSVSEQIAFAAASTLRGTNAMTLGLRVLDILNDDKR